MTMGFEKTLVFLLFIFLGLILKTKFKSSHEINGIKKIILNLALPATIFIALLGIKVEASLLLLPIIALIFNALLFIVSPVLLPMVGVKKDHGFNRYSVWLNHKDRSARVYCRVNTSKVTEVVTERGVWHRHRLKTPQPPALAAN